MPGRYGNDQSFMNVLRPVDDWDHHWNAFAETASLNPAQLYRRKLIFGLLGLEHAPRPVRVLDIGSGQGDFAAELKTAYPDAEVLGVDFSRVGVELSRRKVPTAVFLELQLLEAPDPPPEYTQWATHAVCSEVLEHLDEPEKLLVNVQCYMRPGCSLVVTVPGGPRSHYDRHIGHRKHYSTKELHDLLDRSGLDVVTVTGAGFPFFNLYKLSTIARGKALVRDAASATHGGSGSARLMTVSMEIYQALFRLNMDRSAWGWQRVALARRRLQP